MADVEFSNSYNDDNNSSCMERRNSRLFFLQFLTVPRTVSNPYADVARTQSCAYHVQHIEHLLRATCRVLCHVVQRDSSAVKFGRVEIAFI